MCVEFGAGLPLGWMMTGVGIRVTSKPWFGPKRDLGWGWRVVSWEGRLASAVFILLMVGSAMVGGSWRPLLMAVLLVLFLVIVLLTGDPPGGPSAAPGPQDRSQ